MSFPYQCYTYGTPLFCEAVGYGNITPIQFSFGFYPNGNLASNNELWQGATAGIDAIYIPASYMQTSVTDLAVQVASLCPSGVWWTSQYFGWYYPSDLGKPFFTINGNGNVPLSQTGSGWYFTYQALGPIGATSGTTVTWQLIPSGYPNYSATGTIVSGGNSGKSVTIQWDHHAGFANLKCTASNSCSTVVQYYSVHVQ